MTVFGSTDRFAIEIALHPQSQRNISRSFGMYRFWVAGQAYGRSEPDASSLAVSYDSLRERLGRRGVPPSPWVATAEPQEVLQRAHWIMYLATEDDLDPQRLAAEQAEARRLIMAPDGDEAFDDGSFIVQWNVGDDVIVAAGMMSDLEDPPDGASIVDPVRILRCPAAEFYGVIADGITFFHALEA